MASYEDINYSTRPNKRTQRKMIFEALARYISVFSQRNFGYVGFGSMWFADFLYAHRKLGLKRLISIERSAGYRRAIYNRPFKCVRVIEGDSSEVLPTLNWRKPSIVWLDYDFSPERESLQDVALLNSRLVSSSILMATFDARPPWKMGVRQAARESAVRAVFGESVPIGITRAELTPESYPQTLVSILWNRFKTLLVTNGRAASGLEWSPLFSFYYRDGAPMITIAGALVDPADMSLLRTAQLSNNLEFLLGEKIFSVAVPPLTPKERAEIDRRLPATHLSLPFSLPVGQLKAYEKLYRYYPLFAEVDL